MSDKKTMKYNLAVYGGTAGAAYGGFYVAPKLSQFVPLPANQLPLIGAAVGGIAFYMLVSDNASYLNMFGLAPGGAVIR